MVSLGLFVAVMALSRVVAAEDQQRIEVVLAADPAVVDGVLSVLRGSLERRGLGVDATVVRHLDPQQLFRSPSDRSPAGSMARLWLDLAAKQPTMYLVAMPTGLVYVRPLAVGAQPDQVELELIRFVVESSMQALSEGRALGISREEFERSLAPRPPVTVTAPVPAPVVNRPPPRWTIAAGYCGTVLSSDVVAHGPQLTTELRWPRFQLSAIVLQRVPLSVTRTDVSARLTSTGLRISAALSVALGPRLSASFGVGAGIDATHVRPDGVGATPAFWVTDPLVLAMATLQRSFGSLMAAVDVGADWDLLAARYEAIRAGETTALWTPRRLRPFAATRVGFAF